MRTWFKIIRQLTPWHPSNCGVFLSRTYSSFSFVHLDRTVLLQQLFRQPKYYTWLDLWTGRLHASRRIYSMCMHSCLNTRLHVDMHSCCLFAQICGYACMHACIQYADAPVNVGAQLARQSRCVKKCWCVCECACANCALCPRAVASLPSPTSGWCSTSAQLLSSTQWLLYTRSWHRSRAVMSAGISTTLPMPSSLKIFTI